MEKKFYFYCIIEAPKQDNKRDWYVGIKFIPHVPHFRLQKKGLIEGV